VEKGAPTPSFWSGSTPPSTRSTGFGGGFRCEELDLKDACAVFRFEGKSAKAAFLPEAGGHRVQQVSPTEKKGRVHSSTVTVAVLPEPQKADLRLSPKDLKIETYRAPGPGGQHRNTSDTAVRVTHIPTGVQACSEHKSQHRNKQLALSALKARLIDHRERSATKKRNSKRKDQVGTGNRASMKVRTVYAQRGFVVDHRSGKRVRYKDYERGHLEDLV